MGSAIHFMAVAYHDRCRVGCESARPDRKLLALYIPSMIALKVGLGRITLDAISGSGR